jgi:uncharacterized surface protein with fasciclin (FAS1) repeats
MNLRMAVAASAAAMLVLTACGSDDDTDDTDASTSEDTETTETAEPEEEMADEEMGDDLIAVAEEAGDFTTLLAAVDAAGLTETVSGADALTVFAPPDEAFDALPEGLVDALLLPENEEALTAILTYHVVPGTVTSDMLEDGEVETLNGETVTISVDGPMVNDATITTADIEASNGVIHVIDSVLVPPGVSTEDLLQGEAASEE